jgi:hypothetical protein
VVSLFFFQSTKLSCSSCLEILGKSSVILSRFLISAYCLAVFTDCSIVHSISLPFIWSDHHFFDLLTPLLLCEIWGLKIEAVCSFETLVSTYKSTRLYNSDDQHWSVLPCFFRFPSNVRFLSSVILSKCSVHSVTTSTRLTVVYTIPATSVVWSGPVFFCLPTSVLPARQKGCQVLVLNKEMMKIYWWYLYDHF